MKKVKASPDGFELRQCAEEKLKAATGSSEDLSEFSPERNTRLIHELQVHQVELKMQNDELRRIQAELENSRDKYAHLYDFAPVGYFTMSEKGIIEEANIAIASLLGVTRSALIGKPFTRFVLREDQDLFYLHRQRLLETETTQTCEPRLAKKDGHEFHARIEFVVIQNKGDDFRKIRAAVSDITEERRTAVALKRANDLLVLEQRAQECNAELELRIKELQDFTYVAKHDLQEPLRKIQTFADILGRERGVSLDETSRDYLGRIQAAAARMQDLLNSLLAYSCLTTNAEPIMEADLGKLVEAALSNLELMVKGKKACVEVGDLPAVMADRVQMIQLFQNLIGNALKFSREGEAPHVKIRAREVQGANRAYEIFVEDNGIGFEMKYLDRIFLPFQRLHGRDGNYEGTGMGLAICRKIVERHDGKFTARSDPGKGSTFIVTLPAERKML